MKRTTKHEVFQAEELSANELRGSTLYRTEADKGGLYYREGDGLYLVSLQQPVILPIHLGDVSEFNHYTFVKIPAGFAITYEQE